MYIEGKYWVVVDNITTDRSRSIEELWHYAPENKVVFEGLEALSPNSNALNLRIVPAGDLTLNVEVIQGKEKPFI